LSAVQTAEMLEQARRIGASLPTHARDRLATLPVPASLRRIEVLEGSQGEVAARAARNHEVTPRAGGVATTLLAEANERGADLIVTGGYGHSRLPNGCSAP
jgi:nucleotide-binding universal stress UspA family protein